MKKDKVQEELQKVRYSGSMKPWVLNFIKECAHKEGRSFSDMLERIVCKVIKQMAKAHDNGSKENR